MNLKYHTLSLNLDTKELQPSPVNLPVGYNHVIRLSLTKNGVSGYELPAGSLLTLRLDVTSPVYNPVFSLDSFEWVWDPENQVYEAGFNAAERPLTTLSPSVFAAEFSIVEFGGGLYVVPFHIRFRNTPLPPGVESFSHFSENLPRWFVNFWKTNHRYVALPDKPTLPEVGLSMSTIINVLLGSTPQEQIDFSGVIEGFPIKFYTDITSLSEATTIGFFRLPNGDLYWKGDLDRDPDALAIE